jgi:hypothetical protein
MGMVAEEVDEAAPDGRVGRRFRSRLRPVTVIGPDAATFVPDVQLETVNAESTVAGAASTLNCARP